VRRGDLRCKEIRITGAGRRRNPGQDLPAGFEARRAEHDASLRKPLDPDTSTTGCPRRAHQLTERGLGPAGPSRDRIRLRLEQDLLPNA